MVFRIFRKKFTPRSVRNFKRSVYRSIPDSPSARIRRLLPRLHLSRLLFDKKRKFHRSHWQRLPNLAKAVALERKISSRKSRPPFSEIKQQIRIHRIEGYIDKEKVCKDRKQRREVLFARGKSGGGHRPPRYDIKSLVRC